MRIPFSSLRFQNLGDEVRMGMIVWRYYPRKNETVTFPIIPPTSAWGILKPSYAQKISFSGVRESNPAYLTPYILAGGSFAHTLNDEETAYIRSESRPRELGLDFKYSLSSNLTLDVTLNTDFAQVEADDQQVNLTRFSLFFPEKRLFFQERSSIFDFSTGGPNRTFYSRQIGISEEGPVRILGGARLVGRVGAWDLGFLNMQTDRSEELPSENFGVLRLRRQVVNENSYAGGIITTRYGKNGRYNLVYGLDGIIRVVGDHYLVANWIQSFDDTLLTQKKIDGFNSIRARLQMERRNVLGFGYDLGISTTTEYFNPAIGFVPRTNYTRIGDRISYGWYLSDHPWLHNHTLALLASVFVRNDDGVVESAEVGPAWNFNTKAGGWGSIGFSAYHENTPEEFELADDAVVPIGKYWFVAAKGTYQTPFGSLLRTAIAGDIGTFYDGWKGTIGISPAWTISRHLELSGDYQVNVIRFTDRNQKFDAHIGRIRMRFTLNTEISLSTFTQYNSATGSVGLNLRLRYNPREGNDLYIVYDEGVNVDPLRTLPRKPRNESRAVVLKYSHTFVL
ncbi:MAG: hypothetical protein FJ215_04700 [Ignavibacteria bacterium]|nr:hypothetical protein [Ignavibacteria bacterium]